MIRCARTLIHVVARLENSQGKGDIVNIRFWIQDSLLCPEMRLVSTTYPISTSGPTLHDQLCATLPPK